MPSMKKWSADALIVLLSSFFLLSDSIYAKNITSNFKDRERAIELKHFDQEQKTLPDSERIMVGGYNEEILIEKKINYTIGTHPYTVKDKKRVGMKFSSHTFKKEFAIASIEGCPDSNFEVLKNNDRYSYLLNSCFYTDKNGIEKNSYTYILFDKDSLSAIALETTDINRRDNPLLTYQNDTYKYRWSGKRSDNRKIEVAFDFKIEDSDNVTCTKSWNDECPYTLTPIKSEKHLR